MARSARDSQLETRAARSRLKGRDKSYWRAIRKGKRGGTDDEVV